MDFSHWSKHMVNHTVFTVPPRYSDLTPVGGGAFGQVVSAHDSVLGKRVAIKKLLRPFETNIHGLRTYRELKLLQFMQHENVICLLDLFSPVDRYEDLNELYFVTELMGCDLNLILRSQELEEDHVRFIVYQILKGLKYIHSAGLIHRDLKPSNLAVNENCDLKILDFGLARQTDENMTGYVATRWYRSPEIMLSWQHYGQQLDVWSVGCIMAELFTRQPLFPGHDHLDQLKMITEKMGTPSADFIARIESRNVRNFVADLPRRTGLPMSVLVPYASSNAQDLLTKMLTFDPAQRWSVAQCLAHPYFAGLHDEATEPVAPHPFDSAFETVNWSADELREMTMAEIRHYPQN